MNGIEKLLEIISCGIGKLYEPIHIRRLAKAKADEISIISKIVNDNIRLPINYQDGKIAINTTDANDLVTRAQTRFLFQEMKKQQNIESVVSNAYVELDDIDNVSDIPVEEDWISEFFDCVANVSAEKMQILWGKLLAGEVKKPGSFSLRTLEILKRLSLQEANSFKEIAPFILQCKGDSEGTYIDYFLMPDTRGILLEKYGIPFSKIVLLSEAGLVSENSQINIGFNIKVNHSEVIKGLNNSIKITNLGNKTFEFLHPAYLCTEAGKELLPIVLDEYCDEGKADEYLRECLEEMKKSGLIAKSTYENGDDTIRLEIKIAENE